MTTRRLLVRLLCAVLAVTALLAFCAYTLVKFDELTDLKEKLEALELEVASLESSRSKLEVDVDSLNSSLAELEAKVSALESLGLWMPAFDSGWIDVTNEAGQYFEVVHNLNTTDIVVDIIGRASANGGPHQTNLGAVNHVAGWNTIYGGSHDEEVYSLVKTVDGGYALAGYSSSFGAGLSDFWLVKTTAQGIVSWNRTYGGSEAEIAYSLVQTSDGGYAMAGSVYSYVAGEFDCLLVKTDERGNMQWNKTYGGAKADIAYSLAQTSDGGYVLVGSYAGWAPSPSQTPRGKGTRVRVAIERKTIASWVSSWRNRAVIGTLRASVRR